MKKILKNSPLPLEDNRVFDFQTLDLAIGYILNYNQRYIKVFRRETKRFVV